MKKHLLIIVIVTILVCVGLNGCLSTEKEPDEGQKFIFSLSSEEQKFIGEWSSPYMKLNFYTESISKKVDCVISGLQYKKLDWNIEYGQLCLSLPTPMCWSYSFDGNNKLHVWTIPGLTATLTRVGADEINPEDDDSVNNITDEDKLPEHPSSPITIDSFLGKWNFNAFGATQGTYEFTDNQVIIIDNGKQSTHDWKLDNDSRTFSINYDNQWYDYNITSISESIINFERNGYAFSFYKIT
jgi:hypothetical protein